MPKNSDCSKTSSEMDLRKVESSNVFCNLPQTLPTELAQVLAENKNVRVERIVSTGHRSPDGFWYDQDEHEWVMVLKGKAELRFESHNAPIKLAPGDFILIPAHQRHRVEWTTPSEPTVWLAVFFNT
jgi:cupin 2 domain-containing protein